MAFLSRLLSSLLLLIALPSYAYAPDHLDLGYMNLDDTQKFMIRNGVTVPYNKQFVRRVVVGKAKIRPNGAIINLPYGPEMVPTYDDLLYDPKWQVKEPNIFDNLKFSESAFDFSESQKVKLMIDLLFWTSHIADIYTTYKGVQYSCITEANPLLPSIPSVGEMVALKGGIIWTVKTSFLSDKKYGEQWWYDWKLSSAVLTSFVAYNNHKLTKKSKLRPDCPKR